MIAELNRVVKQLEERGIIDVNTAINPYRYEQQLAYQNLKRLEQELEKAQEFLAEANRL